MGNWQRIFWVCLVVFTSFNVSYTQEQEIDSVKVYVNRKGKVIEKSGDELYFGITPGYSYRSLEENPSLFGKPLGERGNEFGGWFYSFHLGYRTNLHKFVVLDIGFDFTRNGEFYETPGDSVYSYKNTYHFIGIPLKIGFQYGDKLKLHVAGGLVPKMFLNQTTIETVETGFGGTEEIKTIYKDGFNFFNVDAVASVGVRWNVGRNIGIYVLPEARWQLLNTHGKQYAYIHKAVVFGISTGLTILL